MCQKGPIINRNQFDFSETLCIVSHGVLCSLYILNLYVMNVKTLFLNRNVNEIIWCGCEKLCSNTQNAEYLQINIIHL